MSSGAHQEVLFTVAYMVLIAPGHDVLHDRQLT